ncbi:MAG: hypothetical protein ACREIV_14615, partial [Planctomycetaceae bacterium]
PLGELVARADAERLDTPATVVIGAVAAYARQLSWYAPRRSVRPECSKPDDRPITTDTEMIES